MCSENGLITKLNLSVEFLSEKTQLDISDLGTVRKNNKRLTKDFDYLVKGFGFSDFYELCLSAISSEQISKGGNKDFSKLTPVEQTVIRNGKPTKMKIYVDKDKDNEDGNDFDNSSTDNERTPTSAQDLQRRLSFDDSDTKVTPDKVSELEKEIALWDNSRHEEFSSDVTNYLEGRDEYGVLRFLVGFKKQGKFICVDFMSSDATVSGFWSTAFFESLKLALDNKLGLKYPDLKSKALYLLADEYNMVPVGGNLVATFDELTESVGDF